ncbi:hypothetical protein [uncultured Brevundimonas sp.]|uniref:hypothetical protein n=1 Tax=uncultured Brevundimonas sp. TaxID=213418 RepID=UPI0025DDBE94|nr:hypothetical protein [uncultured Brevundimonas sp.]
MAWDTLNAEYAAKGWPLIDPRSPDYCYQPCENGLHVCGFHPDGNNFLTIANVRVRSADEARALFDRAKAELATPEGDDGDFVIDLQMDGECSEDFQMNRQMLDRLMSLASATHHTGAA